MDEKIYLAMLHKIGITQKKLQFIFWENTNYKFFYDNLSSNSLLRFKYNNKQIDYILENKSKFKFDSLLKILKNRDVEIITINENNYPDFLRQIPNPPYIFYLRWKIDNSPKIAVVWSRKISGYWSAVIEKIVWKISNYFTIVSGWAAWCDTKAHNVTLDSWNKTISVIWTWIDIDYPTNNKKLYDNIVSKWWAVISIFPVWEVWNPYNFPIRNELVAGLCVWVLVIEAKKKSWTLITSNLALDMWKDLFSIPWDINKLWSEWCNMLINKWMAKLVTSHNDILEEYNILDIKEKKNNIKIKFNDFTEEKIYNILIVESLTIDELMNKTSLDITTLTFKLSMMEINNYIKKWIWWKYEVF